MTKNRVCLITGVGPGTGSALARRFAKGGHHVAMLARNADRLDSLAHDIPNARPYPVDLSDLTQVRETVQKIQSEMGPVDTLIHNAVAGGFEPLDRVTPELLEARFRVNVSAFLGLAQEVIPGMEQAGSGTIIATGNTSAWRGKAMFAGFAPTKAAQRILAQSMARALGPKGIHVAYVVIDAVIDVPWTRQAFKDKPDEYFIRPAGIADAVFHLAHQERSAWTFELDLRPYGEEW